MSERRYEFTDEQVRAALGLPPGRLRVALPTGSGWGEAALLVYVASDSALREGQEKDGDAK